MYLYFFFFFKQKTAYEMRISDWSSDVCSSDLVHPVEHPGDDDHRYRRRPVAIDRETNPGQSRTERQQGDRIGREGAQRNSADAAMLGVDRSRGFLHHPYCPTPSIVSAAPSRAITVSRSEGRSVGKGCDSTSRTRGGQCN